MDTNPFHFSLEKKDDSWFHWRIRKISFGDKAILFIPSHLAYAGGAGRCNSPNTNIVFEIELLKQCLNNQIDLYIN
jgi:peptidylprolyl isomerase